MRALCLTVWIWLTTRPRRWKRPHWEPSSAWAYEFPQDYITNESCRTVINVSSEMQSLALQDWRVWRASNPAPRWWRWWCRLVCKSTHECIGPLGLAFAAVPRVITGNVVIKLSGAFGPGAEGHPWASLGSEEPRES